jgi:hypothetical protein
VPSQIDPASGRIKAAFATERDAQYALRLLSTLAGSPVVGELRTVHDRHGAVQMVVLEIPVEAGAEDRTITIIRGAHGIPVDVLRAETVVAGVA